MCLAIASIHVERFDDKLQLELNRRKQFLNCLRQTVSLCVLTFQVSYNAHAYACIEVKPTHHYPYLAIKNGY